MWHKINSMTNIDFQSIYAALLPIKPIGNYKGFRQLVSIVEEILRQNNPYYNLSRDIYPPIAQLYECKNSSIERNLRTLLLNIDTTVLQQFIGRNASHKVTVSQLIDVLVIYISFQQ